MAVSSGIAGATARKLMNGLNTDGYNSYKQRLMPKPDFATTDDYEKIRAELTSDEARRVLDQTIRQERYFTRLDLRELRVLCEAEGNMLIYDREVAKLRDAGLPVPIMLTIKSDDDEKKTVQAYGAGGMAKRSAEEARLARNALGLNKQARARIVDEVRQNDLWDELGTDPTDLSDAELDRQLADEAKNVVSILQSRAA